MTELNVNPTRMELKRLKDRLRTAQRGHRLLKDKRDELMRQFLRTAREAETLRNEVETMLPMVYRAFAMAAALTGTAPLEQALLCAGEKPALRYAEKKVMSVSVPVYGIQTTAPENLPISYGFAETSGALDEAVMAIRQALPTLLALAQAEKSVQIMAEELERTRRRVNALEYVLIPRTQASVRTITMRLEENDRATITRLMKVKELVFMEAVERRQAEAAQQAFAGSDETVKV